MYGFYFRIKKLIFSCTKIWKIYVIDQAGQLAGLSPFSLRSCLEGYGTDIGMMGGRRRGRELGIT